MKKVTMIELNLSNYHEAIKIQKIIFPEDNGEEDIKNSLSGKHELYNFLKYWLVQKDNLFIGIAGLYSYNDYPCDAWMGWFGILPDFKQHGYGSFAFNELKKIAQEFNFENLRVYTDEIVNFEGVKFYRKNHMIEEIYENEKGKFFQIKNTLIFSLSLNSSVCEKWNNKCLFLEAHERNNSL